MIGFKSGSRNVRENAQQTFLCDPKTYYDQVFVAEIRTDRYNDA